MSVVLEVVDVVRDSVWLWKTRETEGRRQGIYDGRWKANRDAPRASRRSRDHHSHASRPSQTKAGCSRTVEKANRQKSARTCYGFGLKHIIVRDK